MAIIENGTRSRQGERTKPRRPLLSLSGVWEPFGRGLNRHEALSLSIHFKRTGACLAASAKCPLPFLPAEKLVSIIFEPEMRWMDIVGHHRQCGGRISQWGIGGKINHTVSFGRKAVKKLLFSRRHFPACTCEFRVIRQIDEPDRYTAIANTNNVRDKLRITLKAVESVLRVGGYRSNPAQRIFV